MTETSIYLAQIIGPSLGILGLGIVLNSKLYLRVYKDFKKEPLTLMMLAIALISLGISILLKHFIWTSLADSLVSMIGLALLFKGVFLAILPKTFQKLSELVISKNLLILGGLIWLIAGAYLSWVAYFI